MDAVNAAADFNLRNVAATTYAFGNEKSVLKWHNAAAADKTFVLAEVLNPGTSKGILEFSSTIDKLIITATGENKTIRYSR